MEPRREAVRMSSDFSVIIERDAEGTYVASVPSLRGCHTQGKSLDEVIDRIREAIELCVQTHGADSDALEFVGIQKITVRT
jgi:predicted RNase H-like HicB family nuclease